jgi:hypothetical protein
VHSVQGADGLSLQGTSPPPWDPTEAYAQGPIVVLGGGRFLMS